MRIDITSPDGNTLVALSHATRLLKQVGRADDAKELTSKVFASDAKKARELITEYTNGSIEFFDPREGDEDDE